MRVAGSKAWLALAVIALTVLLGFRASATADEWRQAVGQWRWSFPRDHGAHPEFRTEWWYFTGNLVDQEKNRYGYQLVFFRQGVALSPPNPQNRWSVRDVYLAHFAITDITRNRFWSTERVSRSGPGLAGAATGAMKVWLLDWSAAMEGRKISLMARGDGRELKLELVPAKPLVLHGETGLSQKGPVEGQASFYYSFTDLETRGTITLPDVPGTRAVKGKSWFDQEFGSNQLSKEQVGWDWFSLRLSDGREIMLYHLRRSDGSVEPTSSGTLVAPDGSAVHLKLTDVELQVLSRWKSPRSGGNYPSRWSLKIPKAGIELTLAPSVADQELSTRGSTGVIYYEGAVEGRGSSSGRQVTVEGYVEMTGYAGSLSGAF